MARSFPIFLVIAVYSAWFVLGAARGNSYALQEWREMAFNALSLPSILLFAPLINVQRLFRTFAIAGFAGLVVLALYGIHNAALVIGTFSVSYFSQRMLYKRPRAAVCLLLVLFPFAFKFSKPMIALVAFALAISFILAARLNPLSRHWLLSKFKLRIVAIGLAVLASMILVVIVINTAYDGLIEEAVRLNFLKERITATGSTFYGDLSGGRIGIWIAAIDDWKARPLFGYGLGSSIEAYSSGWVRVTQFHNYFIQALHNTGAIGLMLLLGSWCVWVKTSIRDASAICSVDDRIVRACLLTYVFCIFFYGLYGHPLSYPPSSQLFWLCIGFLCAGGPAGQLRSTTRS